MKVLFCTDGSEISYNAIKNFSEWANDFTADIICVADLSLLPDSILVEDNGFILKCTNTAETVLQNSEKVLHNFGIKTGEKIKMCGAVADTIMEICESKNYDFVILGANGKKRLQKFLGTVAQEVSSNIRQSVYVSKNKKTSQNILFAIDSTDSAKDIINLAVEKLKLNDKKTDILTVYETADYPDKSNSKWLSEIDETQKKFCYTLLEATANIFKKHHLKINKKAVLKGNPAAEIINYCKNNSVDLVVCGARNRSFISKILLSSVSKRILENVNSDVLIIRT